VNWSEGDVKHARRLVEQFGSIQAAAEVLGTTYASLRRALQRNGGVTLHEPKAELNNRAEGDGEVVGRILVVPDVHCPYHHERAWRTMIAAAREYKPTHIVILGDLVDCFQVSDHERTLARGMSLKDELSVAGTLLDDLDSLGASTKYFLQGNHEKRIERYLANKAPELVGLVSLEDSLRLDERGWKWVPYRRDVRLGKVYFCHDAGYAGVNAVRQTRARYEGNVVLGHVHRAATVFEGDARGQAHFGLCPGWLGDPDSLAVDYTSSIQKRREWQHGFAVGELLADDTVHMRVVPIVNGTCVLNGKVVRG
jgi:metallophosphoesterase superfamily enzyme